MARTGRQSLGHSLGEIWPLFPGLFLLIVVFAMPLAGMLPESFVDAEGVSPPVPRDRHRQLLSHGSGASFWLSLVATLICLVLGYPVAYTLVRLTPEGWKRVVYMIVIAPLFTSAVIRAMAWLVILGRRGIVNDALLSIGLIDVPVRLL